MKIKIKKLVDNAVIPSYAKEGDAGLDLTAIWGKGEDMYTEYGTGLSIEIPEGYVGLLFPRSSISNKTQMLSNSVGVIDSGYRGEIKLRFKYDALLQERWEKETGRDMETELMYQPGERVGQLIIVPYPKIEFEEVFDLAMSERGVDGYGSTGTGTTGYSPTTVT